MASPLSASALRRMQPQPEPNTFSIYKQNMIDLKKKITTRTYTSLHKTRDTTKTTKRRLTEIVQHRDCTTRTQTQRAKQALRRRPCEFTPRRSPPASLMFSPAHPSSSIVCLAPPTSLPTKPWLLAAALWSRCNCR